MAMSGELFERYAVPVYSMYILINLTVISAFTAVLIAYKRRYQGLVIEKQWFMFILFPASQVYALFVWFNQYAAYGNYDTRKAIVMVVIDLLADAALLYTIRMTANNTELRIRSEMLEDQIHSQGNYYHHLASTYADIRKMRHDIDNHIYAMEGLLDRGDFQDAKDYIHRLSEQDKAAVPFADCRNTVIASYLEKKREDIISEGITLETDLHLPAGLNISNPDLICIYGNMLDNAIEACRNTDNAKIILETQYDVPYLSISCSNTISGTVQEKKRRIPELERGIGMTILAGLAEQYDGRYTYRSENGMFHTEIILKNKEPEN
jgi:signal transduction histidine kinase